MNQNHAEQELEKMEIEENLKKIKNKVLVLSGKGGVGKSTVASNLAMSLGLNEKKVGVLDIDIHGPSIPKLFGLEDKKMISNENNKIIPLEIGNVKVVSIGFMLENIHDAVIWRGPMKYSVIKQLIKDVDWGELDYLIVDSPPGTGDEPLSIAQLLGEDTKAVIVTTPQALSTNDVRKCINFCSKLNISIIGVLENMSGFVCPECGHETHIFNKNGGKQMATEMKVPFLGSMPIDPKIVESSEEGKPFVYFYSKTNTAKVFNDLVLSKLL